MFRRTEKSSLYQREIICKGDLGVKAIKLN